MTHLEKMFSEGLQERPYGTLDGHVTYKSEMATAEMRETKEVTTQQQHHQQHTQQQQHIQQQQQQRRDFHPTEIHVTELRPVKLDSLPQRGASESHYPPEVKPGQMWERRLQSESGVADARPQNDHSFSYDFQRETHHSEQNNAGTTSTRHVERGHMGNPELKSNMIRTVTSRGGGGSYSGSSPGSSPAGTLSPPAHRRDQGTAEFRRRDVSPDFKMSKVKPNVVMTDGKCQCCPYGYHVETDFMNFCDTVSNQSYLKQLERIQREKRMLRKSMEMYLQDQSQTEGRSTMPNPMENHSQYRETTTNRLLDEIDSSVDQTLTSIDTMMAQSKDSRTRYMDSGSATMQHQPKKFNTFPKKVGKQVAKDLQSYNETFTATLNDNNRIDSNGSLSSISTTASERVYLQPFATTETTTTRTTNMTSQQLAETMAMLLPAEDGAASPQSNMATISREQLASIREAMAVSLQRMKDLEEQVKAVPVLQVRISVLKEEKRLLGLQMEAQKHNTQSRGVGDNTVDSPMSPRFEFGLKTPPPTAPKPKVRMAAVGDHNVHEPYVVQPDLEDSTHVFERDTIIIDRAQRQQAVFTPESKPLTRTVGVGEGNVLDDSLHIHEKELRTVIIGQGISAGKRNVGINCRAPTRDIGVSYNFDSVEKPATRSVGITTELTPLTTNVSFKSEEFTSALRSALKKNVRSMAVQVDSRSERANVGIQSEMSVWNLRSIGVGDCSIDVEVRSPVAHRSVSVDAFPDRMNRAMNTDYGWRLDAMTNTVAQFTGNIATQTDEKRMYNAITNTERQVNFTAGCQTDVMVFMALDQIRNNGTSTEKVLTYNTGMNTTLRPMFEKGINTTHHHNQRNWGVNTDEPNTRNIGVSEDRVDSFVCDLEKTDDDEYRFDEESIETKTMYFETTADQKDTKRDKGYEIKREFAADTHASQSTDTSDTTISTTKSRQGQLQRAQSEESYDESNIEIVEEKIWRSSGEGQFTVTTVTTRRTYGGKDDGKVDTETKTVSGGPEILGKDATRIQEECRRGLSSGGSLGEIEGHKGETVTTLDLKYGEGDSALERVLGKDAFQKYQEEIRAADEARAADEERHRSRGGSSSEQHSTTYSTIIHGGDSGSQHDSLTRSFDSGLSTGSASSSSSEMTRTVSSSSQLSDSSSANLKSIMKKSTSDPGGPQKRGITFAENVIGGAVESPRESESDEETSDNSEADEDADEEGEGEEEEEEEEVEESASRGTTSDSDSSYDEGCYDSRAGSIVYKCKDDEAIANGIPGAKMFDQNIRETFELGREMKEACEVLATYLEDSTKIQTKQLNTSLASIQQEWFKVSSAKLADAHQVEDYLSCFNEISRRALEYIVNMQDSNGNTAIHYAVSNCNFEIVNLLLDTGSCDLNKMNKAGYTAVIMATLASIQTQRQEEVVQRLFSMGNVNIKAAKDGQTAMMFAVRQGREEMVKMLLDTGADLNIQDQEGSTALMCAAEHGHTEIIKLLLNTPGCDATISDNDDSTALSIAMEAGHKDAGVLLYAHVNFGLGHSPATAKKNRKTSGSTEPASPSPK